MQDYRDNVVTDEKKLEKQKIIENMQGMRG